MSAIVDTPVWSELFRRATANEAAKNALTVLIEKGEAILIGPVRQEILSGVRDAHQHEKLRKALRAFPNLEIIMEDYELASTYFNQCRSAGIQGSNTDFLICALASRTRFEILTLDQDFQAFSQVLPIALSPL